MASEEPPGTTVEKTEEEEEPEIDEAEEERLRSIADLKQKAKKTLLLCVGMIAASAALAALYHIELEKLAETINAMKTIREFIVTHNQSLDNLNDSEILGTAEMLVDVVDNLHVQTLVAEAEIDSVMKKINQGWQPHDGSIYYISYDPVKFSEARKECEIRKTEMAIITTPELEAFAESVSKSSRKGVWIGLLKYRKKWEWVDGKTPYSNATSFWKPGIESNLGPIQEECVEVLKDCDSPGMCWDDTDCDQTRSALCKMDPDPSLLPP